MGFERSTEFRVELSTRAKLDLEEIAAFIEIEFSVAAARWFEGMSEALRGLSELPERGTEVSNAPSIRQVVYGTKPHLYRILYRVHSNRRVVMVLHIRHGKRDGLGVGPQE